MKTARPWRVVFTKQAQKDTRRLDRSDLRPKVQKLLDLLATNPFEPPFEKLVGDLAGAWSCRIKIQHQLVNQVVETERVVKILRMWTHYE
ncbi:MAG: Txe/YoeB family addiction module toxin [Thermoanaerobaculia bacterium]